jgi:hypothetical protein
MDWTTFFVVSAGASATLVGLLFIGVQINVERFAAEPKNAWSLLARSTYAMFALLFLGSFMFLVPSLPDRARAEVIVAISAAGIFRAALSWRRVWEFSEQFGGRTFIVLILPLIGYGTALLGSFRLATSTGPPDEARGLVALGFWFLYAVALRNSWSLLFDIRRAPRQ